MNYLRDEQHYIDRYDLFTVEACLRVIDFWRKAYKDTTKNKKLKGISKEDKEKGLGYFLNWELYGTQGEKYRRKKETIQKWIEEDRFYRFDTRSQSR